MTEWEEALSRVGPIHKRGRVCHICEGRRSLVHQRLYLSRGYDQTKWECDQCGVAETFNTPMGIPT